MSCPPNLKDVGWMCHVVPLNKKKEPAFMPPLSQIPDIGCMPEDAYPKEEHKMVFKSTDTPYIQLAKLGGRPDLLCFRENQPNKDPPLPYCRCEWFYLEDNRLENEQKAEENKTKHVFQVPFYMTDHHCKPPNELTKPIVQSTPPRIPSPKRKPKCQQLPVHRPGYADYNRKVNKIGIAKQIIEYHEPIRFPKRDVTECDPTTLPRLLANDYAGDYLKYIRQWKELEHFYKNQPRPDAKNDVYKRPHRNLGPKGNDRPF